MYHPSRGGVRGGRDQFNWDDVKGDKHRENYLGHSIKAPVGRWQKGKDLHWYARDKNAEEEAAARDEIQRLKDEEDEAMQEMLGLAPKKARRQLGQMDPREMSEVLKKVKNQDVEESGPSYAAGERVQGLGFAPVSGQVSSRQSGRGQTGAEQSTPVAYEKVPALTLGHRNEEFSRNEGKKDARNDGPVRVEAQVATRLESGDKTSSTSSEDEGVSSRGRKSEKRKEKQTHQHTRKKSKARESEQDVIAHSHHGARSEGKWKVRHSSEDLEGSRGHTGRRDSRQVKDQSRRDYLLKERRYHVMDNARHDSETSEEILQGGRTTSAHPTSEVRGDSRLPHRRNGKTRHDSESDKETEVSRGLRHIEDQSRRDYSSRGRHDDKETNVSRDPRHMKDHPRRDYLSKDRHDDLPNARRDSEESLQETARRTFAHPNSHLKKDFRSYQSRNGKVSHEGDSEEETEGRRGDTRSRTYDRDNDNGREGKRVDTRRYDDDSVNGREGRRVDTRKYDDDSVNGRERRRVDTLRYDDDSVNGKEGRQGATRRKRHDSVSDSEREGRRGDAPRQKRHDSGSDNEGKRRRVDAPRSSTIYKEYGKRKSRHDSD